jgi:hypothetical protein
VGRPLADRVEPLRVFEVCYHARCTMSLALPNDTHPKIHALQIEGYRKMSPSQKLECIWGMIRTVRELVLLDIRRRHPHADAREQALRVASRFIEPELMLRAFGWDAREVGY